MEMVVTCKHCGEPFAATGSRGFTPSYCSARCRKAASRARQKAARAPFPPEMLAACRWTRCDGKRPIMPDGRAASSTDPATWATFADVQRGAGDGFGFMLGGGFGCVDLDHCLDSGGGVSEFAGMVLARLDGCFTEVSVSGTGLHVFGARPEGRGVRRPGFEVYSQARFIRCTGKVFRPGGLGVLNL